MTGRILVVLARAAASVSRFVAGLHQLLTARPQPVAALEAVLRRAQPVLARRVADAEVYAHLSAMRASAPPAVGNPPPAGHFLAPDPDGPPRPLLVLIDNAARDLAARTDYTRAEFLHLDAAARETGFVLSTTATAAATEAVRTALAADIRGGGTLAQFRTAAAGALDAAGFSRAGVETLYRTEVGKAYSRGQIEILDSHAVRDEFPYFLYVATHDGRVREEHLMMESLGLDGTAVYRADDPVWELLYPPWSFRCRCVLLPLSIEDAAEYGVREARVWLESGTPPLVPEFVPKPPFGPPPGWVPSGRPLRTVTSWPKVTT